MASTTKTPLVLITEDLLTKYSASNLPPPHAPTIHSVVNGTDASAYDLFTVPDAANNVTNADYVRTDQILVIKDTGGGTASQIFSNILFDITRVGNSAANPPYPDLVNGDQIVVLNGNPPLNGGNLTVNDATLNGPGGGPVQIGVVAPGETVRFLFYASPGDSPGGYTTPSGWLRVT